MENSVFFRLGGSVGLLILGSYLFASALSNLLLIPIALELASLSGSQAVTQVGVWQNDYIAQLAFGVLCLIGSMIVAFFKSENLKSITQFGASPQISRPLTSQASNLTTEQLIAELKSRMPGS